MKEFCFKMYDRKSYEMYITTATICTSNFAYPTNMCYLNFVCSGCLCQRLHLPTTGAMENENDKYLQIEKCKNKQHIIKKALLKVRLYLSEYKTKR